MSEPDVCPGCGSDRVGVVDSRRQLSGAVYRRSRCRDCGERYPEASKAYALPDGIVVTLTARGTSKLDCLRRLARAWLKMRAALSL